MNLKLEIICKEYKHKKIIDNNIIVNEASEEYYIIPLTKSFEVDKYNDGYKLTFDNQLLWLKYSNHSKKILLKEYDFQEAIIISSKDVFDIYVSVYSTNFLRKTVWHTMNNVSLNKKYKGKYFLVIPIIDDLIDIHEYGEGIVHYQIHLISNEILLKKASERSKNNCNIIITNNCLLNKEALFVELFDSDVSSFIE